ncbi:uncharacterized protein UV8b_00719 [Ustilaginoidea virens]|uniref:Uncharacterized protein n=1 Tax=Ustilaginoidea virens TaxID=1159556 RepID=A0A063BXP8_USTVR|nr:uncharacterized protein UV8b_00719 [Ustilaginoidea virens]QUC16478.1 hypothetical protein UV8b_00719 [Ustilaginoidea virens]GAO13308.1 hypothetical protein UVI_02013220 [Ustilaginoidea virens]
MSRRPNAVPVLDLDGESPRRSIWQAAPLKKRQIQDTDADSSARKQTRAGEDSLLGRRVYGFAEWLRADKVDSADEMDSHKTPPRQCLHADCSATTGRGFTRPDPAFCPETRREDLHTACPHADKTDPHETPAPGLGLACPNTEFPDSQMHQPACGSQTGRAGHAWSCQLSVPASSRRDRA